MKKKISIMASIVALATLLVVGIVFADEITGWVDGIDTTANSFTLSEVEGDAGKMKKKDGGAVTTLTVEGKVKKFTMKNDVLPGRVVKCTHADKKAEKCEKVQSAAGC